jgi:hypothetical protein
MSHGIPFEAGTISYVFWLLIFVIPLSLLGMFAEEIAVSILRETNSNFVIVLEERISKIKHFK